jgi:hypothetical protein
MSIKYIHREHLDEEKYNQCIDTSLQSKIYAFSWYLDVVCDQWDVLVLNDYEAVMPVPFRKKYLIQYVHPPLWILQLGIFSKRDYIQSDFISVIQKRFRFIELRLNVKNLFDTENSNFLEKQFQELELTTGYDNIKKGYQSDRKKDLKRAEKSELRIEWGGSPFDLITLFQNNVGKRTPEIKEQDYQNLETLINFCLMKDCGELCFVYQGEKLVAAAFFLKYQETSTILCSSTDFSNRKNGANTFLIDQAIQRYVNAYKTFSFGGSSMQSVAKYFFSFGAQEKTYPMLMKRPKFL